MEKEKIGQILDIFGRINVMTCRCGKVREEGNRVMVTTRFLALATERNFFFFPNRDSSCLQATWVGRL